MPEYVKSLNKHLWAMTLGLLLSVIASLSSITLMGAATYFLTMMGIAGFLGISCNIFMLSALIRFCALMRTLLRYAERIINHNLTFRFIESYRLRLYRKVLNLPYELSLNLQNYRVERTLRHDLSNIEQIYIRQALPVLSALVLGVILGLFFWAFYPPFALLMTSLMLLSAAAVPYLVLRLKDDTLAAHARSAEALQEHSLNLILGLLDLKTLGVLQRVKDKVTKLSLQKSAAQSNLVLLENCLNALVLFCANLSLPLSLLILLPEVQEGLISHEMLITLAITAMAAFEFVLPLPAAILSFYEVRHSLKRIAALESYQDEQGEASAGQTPGAAGVALSGAEVQESPAGKAPEQDLKEKDQPQEEIGPNDKAQPLTAEAQPQKGQGQISEIALCGVDFAYGQKSVFKNLNLSFKRAEFVLIQGRVGIGKSTLAALLTGLLRPQNGVVTVDGTVLDYRRLKEYRSHLALSLQDPLVLEGSVYELFSALNPKIKEEKCYEYLDLVELGAEIRALPQGLHTPVHDLKVNFSGGQQRRLNLAQAVSTHAGFLILDEPLEGLDAAMGRRILQRLCGMREGLIIISHQSLDESITGRFRKVILS